MYSRSYTDERRLTLPANYDGTAFKDEKTEKNSTRPPSNDESEQPSQSINDGTVTASAEPKSPLGGLLGFGKGIFSGLFGSPLGLPKLGTEEILIIATALFLLFSKEGDKECAILLLLLLLVN